MVRGRKDWRLWLLLVAADAVAAVVGGWVGGESVSRCQAGSIYICISHKHVHDDDASSDARRALSITAPSLPPNERGTIVLLLLPPLLLLSPSPSLICTRCGAEEARAWTVRAWESVVVAVAAAAAAGQSTPLLVGWRWWLAGRLIVFLDACLYFDHKKQMKRTRIIAPHTPRQPLRWWLGMAAGGGG